MKKGLNAREVALKVLLNVEKKEAYANLALRGELGRANLKHVDRRFVTELVYGTVRSLKTLDWILEQFLKKPLSKQTAATRNILRMGLYQIFYMDSVPVSAACNESAEMARTYGNPGAVKYVNGVLRNIARSKENINFPGPEIDPVEYISLVHSHPQWMVRKWLDWLGYEETIRLCEANNNAAPLTVRANSLKTTLPELSSWLTEQGISVEKTSYAPEGLILNNTGGLENVSALTEGFMQVQDESSILAGHGLSPRPGAKVIDMASAPGGKSTHLAQLMGNNGKIIACDIFAHKLSLVMDNCRRLGINIVETVQEDARKLANNYRNWADYILLDAPCSGLGVLRRRPDARWRVTEQQVNEIAKLQREMMEEAARCLVPGGILLYSTCTITPQENDELIKDFLHANNNFALCSFKELLPSEIGDMEKGYIQLFPHIHNTDGFYMARMQKKDNK
ncbi:MAG: 16S rRNA (cytosine(967)-C(5))-methyltransferase RsmB [Clostridiales bacterium]|nr:16S rRNA (cytosine(967)-C(5))-methyltransferase RsmB [Clostridiales bacterium]MCF8022715.1 16S rRNA (cytosine(967)-C(5))-methyltransferase RsmB [Clostridiales bacterium]